MPGYLEINYKFNENYDFSIVVLNLGQIFYPI